MCGDERVNPPSWRPCQPTDQEPDWAQERAGDYQVHGHLAVRNIKVD